MTPDSWARGMNDLGRAFPAGRGADREELRARSDLYQEKLRQLPDHVWLFAVSQVIERDTFFPAVSKLLEYASEWKPEERQSHDPFLSQQALGSIGRFCPEHGGESERLLYEDVVQMNPKRDDEGPGAYIVRVHEAVEKIRGRATFRPNPVEGWKGAGEEL